MLKITSTILLAMTALASIAHADSLLTIHLVPGKGAEHVGLPPEGYNFEVAAQGSTSQFAGFRVTAYKKGKAFAAQTFSIDQINSEFDFDAGGPYKELLWLKGNGLTPSSGGPGVLTYTDPDRKRVRVPLALKKDQTGWFLADQQDKQVNHCEIIVGPDSAHKKLSITSLRMSRE